MKKSKLSLLLIICGVILLASCNEPEKKQQPSLAGIVYTSADGMDSSCNVIPAERDSYQKLLFLNDSTFVNIMYSCCGGDTVDFAGGYYYSGIYTLNDSFLVLNYNTQCVVEYSKENPATYGTDSSSASITHFEIEKTDSEKIEFDKLNCKDVIYFKQKAVDYTEYLIPTKDTLETYKKELTRIGVWDKLIK
jgi:hypothetical protein